MQLNLDLGMNTAFCDTLKNGQFQYTGAYLERVQRVPRTRGFLEIDKSYLVKHPKFGNYTKVEPVTKNS